VNPGRQTALAQGGATWGEFDRATEKFGLATTGGVISSTGVCGLTLGGGIGWLMGKHGLSCDNVISADLVSAEGKHLRLSAKENEELFWAIRGGGGNFGIVTALEFELVPVPSLFGGGIFFAADDAPAVLHRFRQWAPTMPEEVGTSIAILRIPDMEELPPPLRGQTVVHLRFAYIGLDHAEAERLLSPMKTAGTILLGYVGPMRTDEMDGIHMDPVDPMPGWEKGMLLAELPEEAVDALLEAAGPSVQLPLIMVELRLMGGALRREAAVPNAVAGRAGAFSMLVIGPLVPELAQVVPAVGKGVLAALMPWCAPGVLTNFLGDVSGPAEVLNAWPADAQQRLVAVKRAVDPAGVFTFGHAF
jgi:hypothetical protein